MRQAWIETTKGSWSVDVADGASDKEVVRTLYNLVMRLEKPVLVGHGEGKVWKQFNPDHVVNVGVAG